HHWDAHVERKREGTVAVEGARRSASAPWQALLVPEPGNPRLEVSSAHEARSYIDMHVEKRSIPSLALSARRQTKIHQVLRHLEGQTGRSLVTRDLEWDPEGGGPGSEQP
ncbi:unnamed protein product, partial [Rangifer tarandus platyrhynchus]